MGPAWGRAHARLSTDAIAGAGGRERRGAGKQQKPPAVRGFIIRALKTRAQRIPGHFSAGFPRGDGSGAAAAIAGELRASRRGTARRRGAAAARGEREREREGGGGYLSREGYGKAD